MKPERKHEWVTNVPHADRFAYDFCHLCGVERSDAAEDGPCNPEPHGLLIDANENDLRGEG